MVDFTRVPLRTGSVVATHPGQIQWFDFDPQADGDAILLPTAIGDDPVVTPLLDALRSQSIGVVPPAQREAIDRAIAALRTSAAQPAADERALSLVRHELCAVFLRLHHWLVGKVPPIDPLSPERAAFSKSFG
jgi:hypothetical protein